MSLGGNPFSFGLAQGAAIEGTTPETPMPAMQSAMPFGVPWASLGAHVGESFYRGIGSKYIDAGAVAFHNKVSPAPKSQYRTGKQIMETYNQLGINLDQHAQLSPEAEAYVVQSAADSQYRQAVIQGTGEKHAIWNTTGGLLGGLADPVFLATIPLQILSGGSLDLAAGAGLLGRNALRVSATRATLGIGAAEARAALGLANESSILTRPLSGIWGSRFVAGAANNTSLIGGAYLGSNALAQAGGQHEAEPGEIWSTVLGGAALGGLTHQVFGKVQETGLNTKHPVVADAINKASAEHLQNKLAGIDSDPQAILNKHIAPQLGDVGALVDKIEGRKVYIPKAEPAEMPAIKPEILPEAGPEIPAEAAPAAPAEILPEVAEPVAEPAKEHVPDPELATLSQEVANDPQAQMLMEPEQKAILNAGDHTELASQVGDQIKRLRDTVVSYGEMVAKELEGAGVIDKDNSAFKQLRNQANGALTSLKRQLGQDIDPKTSSLMQDLGAIIKKISSKDSAQVRDALHDLGVLDNKLFKANVLSHVDIQAQHEALRMELAKQEGALKLSKRPEPGPRPDGKPELKSSIDQRARYDAKAAQIEHLRAELAKLEANAKGAGLDEAANLGRGENLSPDLVQLAEMLGLKEKIDGLTLDKAKNLVLGEVAANAKRIEKLQRSISPATGEILDPEAKLLQKYNEELAGGVTKSPADFLEEQSKNLDAIFQRAKGLPDWETDVFGQKALKRLEGIETAHAEAMEKMKAYEAGGKQALHCIASEGA